MKRHGQNVEGNRLTQKRELPKNPKKTLGKDGCWIIKTYKYIEESRNNGRINGVV